MSRKLKVDFEYSKLRGKIVEIFRTLGAFSDEIGLSPVTVKNKLDGTVDWTTSEIIKVCDVLGIKGDEMLDYFFTKKVR